MKYLETLNALGGDEGTVVKVNALKIVALKQMLKAGICEGKTVVQFKDDQMLCRTRSQSQSPDSIIRDLATVGQTEFLQSGTTKGQMMQSGICDQVAVFQIQVLQQVTTL